jgi:hypothetical protein
MQSGALTMMVEIITFLLPIAKELGSADDIEWHTMLRAPGGAAGSRDRACLFANVVSLVAK